MTSANKVVLYNRYRSSPSWRVRVALAWKNVEYEYDPVYYLKNGEKQKTDEYRILNPLGQVPTLQVDDNYVTQSMAIIEYLEEKYPDPPLLPKDLIGRAKVRAMAEVINSGIQPLINVPVLQKVGDDKVEWARSHITKGFAALEAMLEKTAGKYCYGDQVTLVDVFLVPQVDICRRFEMDISKFPIICRVNENLVKLPAFIAADAFRQPDTPEHLQVN